MERSFLIFIAWLLIISCGNVKGGSSKKSQMKSIKTTLPIFQDILDSADVRGSIMLYDHENDHYYSNNFEWAEMGHLPASTFKIPNSIIALESNVVDDELSIIKWDRIPRNMSIWEQDLTFRKAFRYSCVPCYQEIASKIGVDSMRFYLDKLDYKGMIVDSSSIDIFWLVGESKINQYEQIDFLKRFYFQELSIKESTFNTMKKVMLIDDQPDYRLSGKTGWSIRDGKNNGWFVGYLESENKVYFFAVNIDPNSDFNMNLFPKIRSEVAMKAFTEMKIIIEE